MIDHQSATNFRSNASELIEETLKIAVRKGVRH